MPPAVEPDNHDAMLIRAFSVADSRVHGDQYTFEIVGIVGSSVVMDHLPRKYGPDRLRLELAQPDVTVSIWAVLFVVEPLRPQLLGEVRIVHVVGLDHDGVLRRVQAPQKLDRVRRRSGVPTRPYLAAWSPYGRPE